MTETLTTNLQQPSKDLVLRHFEYQNKFKRGNIGTVGSVILRHFYNNPDGKINYNTLSKDGLSKRQVEKFVSKLRKDGWLCDDKRGYSPINYQKIISLETELVKQGFLWGFRAADNDVIFKFRRKAHATCLAKGKKAQAEKIWKYTTEEIRLKILTMIGKGHKVVFQSIEHFINYMAKFLEFELCTKKFLGWVIKKIKEKGQDLVALASKTPSALADFFKKLNHTVSYISKIKKTLVFKTIVSSKKGEEKENKIKEKEMVSKLSDQELIHKIMGKPREVITDVIGYMTVKMCQTACGDAKRYNKWFEPDFTTMAIRGLMMDIIRKRKEQGKPDFVFYGSEQLQKYITDRLRDEKRPNWALEKLNTQEYQQHCEFVQEQEDHDMNRYGRREKPQNFSVEEEYFNRSNATMAALNKNDLYNDTATSFGNILQKMKFDVV